MAEAISVAEAARDAALAELQTAGENLRQAAADHDALQEEADELDSVLQDVVTGCWPYSDGEGGWVTNTENAICVERNVMYGGSCIESSRRRDLGGKVVIEGSSMNSFSILSSGFTLFTAYPVTFLHYTGVGRTYHPESTTKFLEIVVSNGGKFDFIFTSDKSNKITFDRATGTVLEGSTPHVMKSPGCWTTSKPS